MTQRLKDAIEALTSLKNLSEEEQQSIATGVLKLVESVKEASSPPSEWGPAWRNLTTEERLADFRAWLKTKTEGVGLPGEALRRENMYD